MPGSYLGRTPFSRSAAMTANRAGPPYATAHHERRFDGNKRVSIKKRLIMSGFAGGRPFQAAAKGVATLVAETLMTGALATPENENGSGADESWSGLRNEPKQYLNGGQGRQYPARNSCIAKRTQAHPPNCPEFNARRNGDFHRTQAASGGSQRLKLGLGATTAAGYTVIENFPSQDEKITKRPHGTTQIRFERSKSTPQRGGARKSCARGRPIRPQFARNRSNPRLVHPKSEIRNPKSQALL
jgi:hypothetical protein